MKVIGNSLIPSAQALASRDITNDPPMTRPCEKTRSRYRRQRENFTTAVTDTWRCAFHACSVSAVLPDKWALPGSLPVSEDT
ncbi:hypothetical protein DSECCO2_363680 [anaerobic digester metagenome]